jgi:hypothetical protein
MADSPPRSNAGSRSTESDCSQLTLEDWEERMRAVTEPEATAPRRATSGEVVRAANVRGDGTSSRPEASGPAPHRPSATELLETPGALLTRSHLRELGLERRAIDAVFRTLAVVVLPGYSRPMIRAEEFLELVEQCTYRDDRVRLCHA